MKIFETPKAARVRSGSGVPAFFGACGVDPHTAVRTDAPAGFRRTPATAMASLRTWSPPIT